MLGKQNHKEHMKPTPEAKRIVRRWDAYLLYRLVDNPPKKYLWDGHGGKEGNKRKKKNTALNLQRRLPWWTENI